MKLERVEMEAGLDWSGRADGSGMDVVRVFGEFSEHSSRAAVPRLPASGALARAWGTDSCLRVTDSTTCRALD